MQAGDKTEVASLLSEATELIRDFMDTERLLRELQKILAQVVSHSLCVHIVFFQHLPSGVATVDLPCPRAANCYDFGVAATLFNPDYAATLVTSMLRL